MTHSLALMSYADVEPLQIRIVSHQGLTAQSWLY